MVDLGIAELLVFIVWVGSIWSWSANDDETYRTVRFFFGEFLIIGAALPTALFSLA